MENNPSTPGIIPRLAPEPAIIRDLSYYSLPAPAEKEFTIVTKEGAIRVSLGDTPRYVGPNPGREIVVEHLLPAESIAQVGNSCGPTSAAIVLAALGVPASIDEISRDADYHTTFGTSPFGIRDAIAARGLEVALLNESRWEEVISLLDRGTYCIAIVMAGEGLHYEVITGYRIFKDGTRQFQITNTDGHQYFLSEKGFDDSWQNISFRGIETGFSRAVIVIGGEGSVPPERIPLRAQMLSSAHRGINSSLNFCAALPTLLCSIGAALMNNGTLAVILSNIFLPAAESLSGIVHGVRHFARAALDLFRKGLVKKAPLKAPSLKLVEGERPISEIAA